jgi:hypothetical protein
MPVAQVPGVVPLAPASSHPAAPPVDRMILRDQDDVRPQERVEGRAVDKRPADLQPIPGHPQVFVNLEDGLGKMLPDGARDRLLRVVNTARDRLVVTWLSDGGFRIGELWGLHLADLHLREGATCGDARAAHAHVCHREENRNRSRVKSKYPWCVWPRLAHRSRGWRYGQFLLANTATERSAVPRLFVIPPRSRPAPTSGRQRTGKAGSQSRHRPCGLTALNNRQGPVRASARPIGSARQAGRTDPRSTGSRGRPYRRGIP